MGKTVKRRPSRSTARGKIDRTVAGEALRFGITGGMRSSDGGRFYEYTGPEGKVWFSGSQWLDAEKEVRSLILERTGTMISAAAALRELRDQIDGWSDFRDGKVAEHPGWLGNCYVAGDGTECTVDRKSSIEIVAFQPLDKYRRRGDLRSWHAAMAPFVREQPLPYFVCALALSGPIHRLLPAGAVTSQVELVGESKSGKSTLGTLAASVWAGVPGKTEGGGESWDMTAGVYDMMRIAHRDMFLLLDEAEGGTSKPTERRELAKAIVFKGAGTGTKKRMTDKGIVPELHVPVLSTTNKSVRDVLRGEAPDVIEATASRMISIVVARNDAKEGLPVFVTVPLGFKSANEAVRKLRTEVNNVYGSAGPAFATALVKLLADDESGLRDKIARLISAARVRLQSFGKNADERHIDMLAAVECTALLAQEAEVLPREWGDPSQAIDRVFLDSASGRRADPEQEVQRFSSYVKRLNKDNLLGRFDTPFLPEKGLNERVPAFVRTHEGDRIVFIRPDYLRRTFDRAQDFLNAMRVSERSETHRSETHRLQIQAPLRLKRYGFRRVYAIRIKQDNVSNDAHARQDK